MVIQTFDTIYAVVSVAKSDKRMPVYLCRNETDHELYQLFQMEKSFLREDTVSYLNEQLQNKNFSDFKDMFLFEDKFYVVMRYYSAPSLQDKMNENLEDMERLAIVKKVFEAFLVTEMSPFFCCQYLQPEKLLLTESMDIQAAYTLDDVEMASVIQRKDCWDAASKLLQMLWAMELKNNTVPEIQEFMRFLASEDEKSMETVYQSYRAMIEQFVNVPEEERRKPKRFLFLLWERLRKGIPVVKKIAAVLIFLALAGILVYTVWQEQQPSGEQKQQLKYIGTLDLKE